MAECLDFLGKCFEVYDDLFDGFANEVSEELVEDRGIDPYCEYGEKLICQFESDFLINDLFAALQEAFDRLTPSHYWDRWNEKLDEMIGASK